MDQSSNLWEVSYSDQFSTVKTNAPLCFTNWHGFTLETSLLEITCSQSIEMTLSLQKTAMDQLLHEGWFHTWPFALTESVHFEENIPIKVTLELEPSIASIVLRDGQDAEDVITALFHKTVPFHTEQSNQNKICNDSLAFSECWYLLEAVQEMTIPEQLKLEGTIYARLRTIWHPNVTTINPSVQTAEKAPPNTIEKLPIMQQLHECLEKEKLRFDTVEPNLLRIPFSGKGLGKWTLILHPDEKKSSIAAYSTFPFTAAPEHHETVSFVLLQCQQALEEGSFELDTEDGVIRFRSILPCPELVVSSEALQTLIGNHMVVIETFSTMLKPYN